MLAFSVDAGANTLSVLNIEDLVSLITYGATIYGIILSGYLPSLFLFLNKNKYDKGLFIKLASLHALPYIIYVFVLHVRI